MKRVQVIPVTRKGEDILRSNTDKFGIGKVQSRMIKKIGDKYTITELIDNPFSIIVTVRPEFEQYVSDKVLLEKTIIAVEKIMIEHNGSLSDVNIEVKE